MAEQAYELRHHRTMVAVPSGLMTDATVSAVAVRLWCHLAHLVDKGLASTDDAQVAADIFVTPAEMSTAQDELVTAGWVTVEHGAVVLLNAKIKP